MKNPLKARLPKWARIDERMIDFRLLMGRRARRTVQAKRTAMKRTARGIE